MVKLRYYKTFPEVVTPKYGTEKSACFDLSANWKPGQKITYYVESGKKIEEFSSDFLIIAPGEICLVPTGLIFDIPEGYDLDVYARGSTSLKKGLILSNSVGIVDQDYYHETFMLFLNVGETPVNIFQGERLAQARLVKKLEHDFEETLEKPGPKSDRNGGFGSTDKN